MGSIVQLPPIPVVDLCELTADLEKQSDISAQLNQGLLSHTCVYLTNVGIPGKVIENMFDKSRQFFELPPSAKNLHSKTGSKPAQYGGYYVSNKQSFRERFDIMFSSPQPLPEEIGPAYAAYKEGIDAVARFIFSRIATALGLQDLHQFHHHHQGALGGGREVETKAHCSLLYYNHNTEAEFIMEQHTDFSTMTLLFSSAPGVQVEMPDGEGGVCWANADPLEGAIFLHVGDLLERWTGGIYKATVHRVKRFGSEAKGRQSIPYFIHPDVNSVVEPLVGENKELYPPISAGDYWRSKMGLRRPL